MNVGIIDLGSNTIRLSIYSCEGAQFKLMTNKKTMAGIISYVENGELNVKGIDRICEILSSYLELLHNFDIHEVHCFSTASLRLINNRNEVLEQIEKRCGLVIDLISGLEEAKLDFIGAKLFTDISEGVLIDIGGGSTELVAFKADEPLESYSMSIGSLSMYNRFVKGILPSKDEKKEIKHEVILNLQRLKSSELVDGNYRQALGVGGTIRAVLAISNDVFGYPKNNRKIETVKIKKMLALFKHNGKPTIQKLLQTAPDRIHTLIPGMIVLYVILKTLGIETVTVAKSGVREGYLYHKVLKEGKCDESKKC